MLERIDRVQMVVADRAAAASHYRELLGAEIAREDESDYLGASRTVVTLGESEIELCQPEGAGPVRRHLEEHGEGLFAAGASTRDLPALEARLRSLGSSSRSPGTLPKSRRTSAVTTGPDLEP